MYANFSALEVHEQLSFSYKTKFKHTIQDILKDLLNFIASSSIYVPNSLIGNKLMLLDLSLNYVADTLKLKRINPRTR